MCSVSDTCLLIAGGLPGQGRGPLVFVWQALEGLQPRDGHAAAGSQLRDLDGGANDLIGHVLIVYVFIVSMMH